jgi:hypothetical protein
MFVPEHTTLDARPWYPTGSAAQFSLSAFEAPRNIVPTFVACSL